MNEFPFADFLVLAIFAVAVAATVVGALIAALSHRIIRGVSGLMVSCIGLAGLYYFLNSPFLALMEILIYVGAVCVTIIFGVMLSEPDEPPAEAGGGWRAAGWSAGAVAVCAALFFGLSAAGLAGPWPVVGATERAGSVADIGVSLLTDYSLPFELISLVLLTAILGALVIARAGRTKE
jgi:NADH-quinone oxidoreductase subunit J